MRHRNCTVVGRLRVFLGESERRRWIFLGESGKRLWKLRLLLLLRLAGLLLLGRDTTVTEVPIAVTEPMSGNNELPIDLDTVAVRIVLEYFGTVSQGDFGRILVKRIRIHGLVTAGLHDRGGTEDRMELEESLEDISGTKKTYRLTCIRLSASA